MPAAISQPCERPPAFVFWPRPFPSLWLAVVCFFSKLLTNSEEEIELVWAKQEPVLLGRSHKDQEAQLDTQN